MHFHPLLIKNAPLKMSLVFLDFIIDYQLKADFYLFRDRERLNYYHVFLFGTAQHKVRARNIEIN